MEQDEKLKKQWDEEHIILNIVNKLEPISKLGLCVLLGEPNMDRKEIDAALSRLTRQGLITLRPSPFNKRRNLIYRERPSDESSD